MQLHEVVQCPVCGAQDRVPEPLGDGHVLNRCRRCQAVSASSYADPQEIYRSGYFDGDLGDFGLNSRHPLFQRWLLQVSERRLDFVARHLPKPGAVLDVGCGAGEFLQVAQERGWSAHGVDPVPDAAEQARNQRGLDVVTTTLQGYGHPEPRFDLICALHVLEHMPKVRNFVQELAAWSAPGGHVLIEVPNWNSLARRRHLANWSGLRPLEHVTHFTVETLTRAFRLAGLTPVQVITPTYAGPPQELKSALTDLELRSSVWRTALGRTCTPADRDGVAVLEPTPLTWTILKAVERANRARAAGTVVLGLARVGP